MSTRCRPGDLAMVVSSNTPAHLGRLVFVERELPDGAILHGYRVVKSPGEGLMWELRWANGEQQAVHDTSGLFRGFTPTFPGLDSCLRPIRPQPDEETQEPAKEPHHEPA